MGSSKKHRGERGGTEASEEATGSAGRPREHRKHRHRAGERRGKRSRSRGERSGAGGTGTGTGPSSGSSSRRGGSEETAAARSGHGRTDGGESGRRSKRERREEREESAPPPKAASGETSLSVEETNKLRAKLGLKPLEVSAPKKEAGSQEQPVVAEVVNPMAMKQRQEIRERLAAAKEKRLQNQKLGKVKPLGEGEPWLDDAAAWIERSRQLQKEREMAEKREKLLEEMEQEFGVSSLVEEEFMRRRRELYSARDLQGLAVQHDPSAIREGQTLVLTLKDKGVLEDSEDVLLNPTLAEAEAAAQNVELRRRKPGYDPYGEGDGGDAAGKPPPSSLLPQYDEVLTPPQRPTFRLGPHGTAGGEGATQGSGGGAAGPEAQSLELPPLRLAAEYLSPEEFRKPRRRVRRLRRRERLRADELLPSAPPQSHGDFGSRTRGRGRREEEEEEEESLAAPPPRSPPCLMTPEWRAWR